MREALAKVPPGTYSFEDQMDDYGPGTGPIRFAVDITFAKAEGAEVTVDFSRSSDAVPAAINSYINYTRAYALFAIKVFCDPLSPQNAGAMRPIRLMAREGSFFNPKFPAPSGGRAALQVRIFDTINGALAQAMPERAMGAFTHWANPNIGGIDDRTGKPFVFYDLILAGYGGRLRLRRAAGSRAGDELLQHPGGGARDPEPGADPPAGVAGRHRRGRAASRRRRPAQGRGTAGGARRC